MTQPHPDAPHRVTPLFGTRAIPDERLRFPLDGPRLEKLVRSALDEDGAFNDLTTIATVISERRARGTIRAWGVGVISGVPLAVEAFRLLHPRMAIRVDIPDGGLVEPGTAVMCLSGHARALLSAERVALNFMQRLSGIASLTARYVAAVRGSGARILDTRKTTPGFRLLEKYAVRCGGGTNHRLDLSDAVLMKDNHLSVLGGDIARGVRRARQLTPQGTAIEVECETREQVEAALAAGVDIILLDNMKLELLRECVAIVGRLAVLEASGGITLDNVRAIADTGVDYISIGALTHSAPALNLALDFESGKSKRGGR